jgi:DNA polymerase III sliding clamp (beta) subunit (PCNA family)
MKLSIENKSKLEMFVALFQLLKNWSTQLNLQFEPDQLYIQTMDKSHICLSNIVIKAAWFSEYFVEDATSIAVDTGSFATMMNYAVKHNKVDIIFNQADKLFINLTSGATGSGATVSGATGSASGTTTSSNNFDHFFELPLMDAEQENLSIPAVDYDVEFSMDSKKFSDLISELMVFGPNLNIVCTEDLLEFNSSGDTGKLKVNIPIDSLNEFAISEGEKLDISYSLAHIGKMCLSSKLSGEIGVGISAEYPMSLKYSLGEDSSVAFFVAPKIAE